MSDRVICHLQTAAVLLLQCQDASAIASNGNDTAQIELVLVSVENDSQCELRPQCACSIV